MFRDDLKLCSRRWRGGRKGPHLSWSNSGRKREDSQISKDLWGESLLNPKTESRWEEEETPRLSTWGH